MPRAKPKEPWLKHPYNFRITPTLRIDLARLGGAKWIREQIKKATNDSQNKQ